MSEQAVADMLQQDLSANMAVIQLTVLLVCMVMAVVAGVLAMRALAMLTEARQLRFETQMLLTQSQISMSSMGASMSAGAGGAGIKFSVENVERSRKTPASVSRKII